MLPSWDPRAQSRGDRPSACGLKAAFAGRADTQERAFHGHLHVHHLHVRPEMLCPVGSQADAGRGSQASALCIRDIHNAPGLWANAGASVSDGCVSEQGVCFPQVTAGEGVRDGEEGGEIHFLRPRGLGCLEPHALGSHQAPPHPAAGVDLSLRGGRGGLGGCHQPLQRVEKPPTLQQGPLNLKQHPRDPSFSSGSLLDCASSAQKTAGKCLK